MKYHEHTSHPGFGWIEPLMDQDDALIFSDVAKRIIEAFEDMRDGYRETDWYHACNENPKLIKLFDDDAGPAC